ncbi:helix-turn-helix transcriptional regulator [Gluconobacter oxydans]|uniref:helix-turn-helix transcriptional regulator n=1 Tax=Gluconobacter oxydans TaxID=442 RepID=UPI0007857DFB|nr:helix-turn-helix domain-containing protein [Gluconobacter oxydans]KXV11380.1 hypothetical protein AD932_13100 [Gluconobacter oxydans]MCP1247412.1 helix-turn-helix domain-containing protein [Gluconobacter oxydans]
MTTKQNRYASIKKIGEDFGMSRSTIYRALHAGRFKAVKCGRLTRICVASVEQYFANLPAMGAA